MTVGLVLINRGGVMNTLVVMLIGLVWFYLAYRFYGNFIRDKIVKPEEAATTPAHKFRDDIDYSPGKKIFLWGNHFAAIAGAGPIVGPILAVSFFGWGYTALWIMLGSVFIGAIHDYLSLMISVRNEGKSIANIAGDMMGKVVHYSFAILLYIVLLLVVAVFMDSVAQAFVNVPQLVIPTLGLVGVAIIMGLMLRSGFNEIFVAIFGVALAYFLVWVGMKVPVVLPAAWGQATIENIWLFVLSVYCVLASISPIWLILRPRDFVSSVMLIVGMSLGLLGIFIVHPAINAPFHLNGFFAPNGSPVWPILFIIVACGAISGFHSIVATGTTTKQLNKETDAKGIAFGAMLMEAVLGLLVVMIVVGGLKWGFAPKTASSFEAGLYFGNALSKNWIIAFGHGFGNIVSQMHIPLLTFTFAALLGATMVKSFILTTLDMGTRLARLIISETFGSHVGILKNRLFSSLVLIVPAFLLAITKAYTSIWTLFGATNQLVAFVTLITITAYLIKIGRPKMYTLIPAIFMLLTTGAALLWETFNTKTGFLLGAKPMPFLGVLAILLLILMVVVVYKSGQYFYGLYKR